MLTLTVVLQMQNMCEGASKLTKNWIFLKYLNLECFYLVIQVGSTNLNDNFWLAQDILDFLHKEIFLVIQGAEKKLKKNIQVFKWISHPCWFVPYGE